MKTIVDYPQVPCQKLNKLVQIEVTYKRGWNQGGKPTYTTPGGMTDCYSKAECKLGNDWGKACPIREDRYDICKSNFNAEAQKCLNPNCRAILFISEPMDQDTDTRGIDRDIQIQRDDQGPYIECPQCHAQHILHQIESPEGGGITYRIAGLR